MQFLPQTRGQRRRSWLLPLKAFVALAGLEICIKAAFNPGVLIQDFEWLLGAGTFCAALILLISGSAQITRRRRRLEGVISLSWAAIAAVLLLI